MSWKLCWRPCTILYVFVRPGLSGRLFTWLSLHDDDWFILAYLGLLILHVGSIYSHLHAAQWCVRDGCYIAFPFDVATSLNANRAAQPTILNTLSRSTEKNEAELCRTVRNTWWRHSLSDHDRFKSQQSIRWPLRGAGTSVIPRRLTTLCCPHK